MRDFIIKVRLGSGFTDQLNQFLILYTLATQLHLRYLPARISTKRNTGNTWADLALSERLAQPGSVVNDMGQPNTAIHVDDNRNGVRYSRLSDVLADLRVAILKSEPNDILAFQLNGNRDVLMHLLGDLPASAFERFRLAFDDSLADSGIPSPFEHHKRLRVLFHIRKGDTARIETPWEGALTLWHNQAAVSFSNQPEDVTILRSVARRLSTEFGPDLIELVIFSDGYERTALLLDKTLSNSSVFSNGRKDIIRAILQEKTMELELFGQIPGSKLFIGERHDYFKQLLLGIREADVIITNGVQRLPSKVLGALPSRSTKQRLIVVGADTRGSYYHTNCFFNRENCDYIPVSWKDFTMEPILTTCHNAIAAHGIDKHRSKDHLENICLSATSTSEHITSEHYNVELIRFVRNASNINQALGRLNEALANIAFLRREMPGDRDLEKQEEEILDWIVWLERNQP
jgi:hypothetical protein